MKVNKAAGADDVVNVEPLQILANYTEQMLTFSVRCIRGETLKIAQISEQSA